MITIQTTVNASLEKAWEYWTEPKYITNWNFASDDWECSKAENDLRVGGKFLSTMSTKDGSASFDFSGEYTEIDPLSKIKYSLGDGRKVEISFEQVENGVQITESFDPENENTLEIQQSGWQAILDNYKKCVEAGEVTYS